MPSYPVKSASNGSAITAISAAAFRASSRLSHASICAPLAAKDCAAASPDRANPNIANFRLAKAGLVII